MKDKVHDYREQMVRDCRAFGKTVYLHLRKRRYACPDCGKRFYEENGFLPRYYQVTQRLKVKYVVMDMSSLFLGVANVCFPKAKIVSDKYHVVRQAGWTLENGRKAEQKRLSDDWRKYCKRSRCLLLKDPDKLSPEEKEKLLIILGLSTRIQHAWELKNELIRIMRSESLADCRKKLADWVCFAENSHLPEFNACTRALHNWSESIFHALDCRYSNGYTEECNNKTKVLKRVCFGVVSAGRF